MADPRLRGAAAPGVDGWWLALVLAAMGGALGVLWVAAAEADPSPIAVASEGTGEVVATLDPDVAFDDGWGPLGP